MVLGFVVLLLGPVVSLQGWFCFYLDGYSAGLGVSLVSFRFDCRSMVPMGFAAVYFVL